MGCPLAPKLWVKNATSLAPTDQPSMAVPLNKDSINRPYPPRRTVLLLLKTRQAKPTRGAKSRWEELRKDFPMPACEARMMGVGATDSTNPGLRLVVKAVLFSAMTAPVFRPFTIFW